MKREDEDVDDQEDQMKSPKSLFLEVVSSITAARRAAVTQIGLWESLDREKRSERFYFVCGQ